MKLTKKVLAVVLALAMILGMTVTASAAFEGETITYKTAVEVLTLSGVIEGDQNGKFNPTATLTRAEATKIIVCLLGMEDVSTSYTANFGDIKGHWAEKYINIAAGLGIVAGVGNGKFAPDATLTGYQWAKMLATAMGYNAEYEALLGAGWEANTAKLIKKLAMTKGIAKFAGIANVSREEACQMAYNLLAKAFVEYETKGLAYSQAKEMKETKTVRTNVWPFTATETVITDSFAIRLGFAYTAGQADAWGRPGTVYFIDADKDGVKDATEKYITLYDEPVVTYTEAVNKCDLLVDLGVPATVVADSASGQATINVVRNNVNRTAIQGYHNSTLNAATGKCFAATEVVGAQGLITEVYELADGTFKVVQIDTYLAVVTEVKEAKTDAKNHTTAATTKVTVFDGNQDSSVVLTDLTGYAVGDYILVQLANDVRGTKAAGSYNVVGKADTTTDSIATLAVYATSTTLTGGTYKHAEQYHLGYGLVTVAKENRTWFFDQFGNLIGNNPIYTATNYAVVKNIQRITPVGAAAYTQATLVYMDGSEATVTLDYNTSVALAAYFNSQVYSYLNYVDGTLANGLSDTLYKVTVNATTGACALTAETATNTSAMTKGVANVAGDFHTANSTSYLVRTGKGTAASPYTWTTAVSFQNVEYAKATYTLVGYEDGDKANQALIDAYVAKYAYVTNTSADEVTSYNLVYFVNPAVNANLTVVGGEYYATLTGGVDMNGEAVALTVNVTKQCTDVDGKQLGGQAIATKLTKYCGDLVERLYVVTITSDVAVNFEEVTDLTSTVVIGGVKYNATYVGKYADLADGLVKFGGVDYNYLTAAIFGAKDGVLYVKGATETDFARQYAYVIAPYATPTIAKTFFLDGSAGKLAVKTYTVTVKNATADSNLSFEVVTGDEATTYAATTASFDIKVVEKQNVTITAKPATGYEIVDTVRYSLDGASYVDSDTVTLTQAAIVEFTGKATPKTVVVTFDNNGQDRVCVAEISKTVKRIGGETSTVAAIYDTTTAGSISLGGYEFLGWSSDPNATTAAIKAGDKINLDEAATLYAVWKAKTYTKVEVIQTNGAHAVYEDVDVNVNTIKTFVQAHGFTWDDSKSIVTLPTNTNPYLVLTLQPAV